MMSNLVRVLAATVALGVSSAAAQQVAPSSSTGEAPLLALQSSAVKNGGSLRVIVQLKEGLGVAVPQAGDSDAAATAALHSAQNAVAARALGSTGRVLSRMDVVPMFVAKVNAGELSRLASDPSVARIYEDKADRPLLRDALPLIRMTGAGGAYGKNATGVGRAVAIIDSGVNKKNEFVAGRVISEACFNTTDAAQGSRSQCPGGRPSSIALGSGADCAATIVGCGHGTHVAGIAAGRNPSVTANQPANGVALSAGIVAINVFSKFTGGPCGGGTCILAFTSDQIKGLERVFALRNGVANRKIDAVNMSLGGGGTTGFCNNDPRKPIIDKLRNAGIATVISSGNSSFVNGVGEPACIQTAITVGSSTKKAAGKPERMAFYSNQGPQVDTLAPGGDSDYPFGTERGEILSSQFNGYAFLQGTSMAAPMVTGAIAAIRSRAACRTKTVAAIEKALQTTGLKIKDHRTVPGRPDIPQLTERRMDVPAVMAALGCG